MMTERQHSNILFSERDYIAPQNSIVEDTNDKITRYDKHPYHESHSAPPSVYVGDSLLNVECDDAFENSNADLCGPKSQLEPAAASPLSGFGNIKSNNGFCISNKLQEKLYQYPTDSDAFKHNNHDSTSKNLFLEERESRKPDKLCFDTFLPISQKPKRHHENKDPKIEKNTCNTSDGKDTSIVQLHLKSQDHKALHDKSILNIIHYLYNRLDWPCQGLLNGIIPKVSKKANSYCISQKKVDDGEFVYCIPRCYFDHSLRYDPYDLRCVDPKSVQSCNLYYTVSATYVSRYSALEGNSMVPTIEWLQERSLFQKVFSIKTFRNHRIWKSFSIWKLCLRSSKNILTCDSMDTLLFQNNVHFQTALLKVRSLCEKLFSLISSNDSSSMIFTSITKINMYGTFTVGEFGHIQKEELDAIRTKIDAFRADVIGVIGHSCRLYQADMMKDINLCMDKVEDKTRWEKKVSNPTQKVYKNFQALKAKYNILESSPSTPENSNQKSRYDFSHAKHVFVKALYRRMYSFIRLVDFLVMDILRKLVIRALEDLKSRITFSTKNDSKEESTALFQIHLNLSVEDPSPKDMNNNRSTLSTFLSPSFDEILVEVNDIIHHLKSIPLFFKTLTDEPLLKPFITISQNANSREYDNGTSEEKTTKWPELQLLFDKDEYYQGICSEIMNSVSGSLELVEKYVRQYDDLCQSTSDLKIGEIKESVLDGWRLEKFREVLARYIEQIDLVDGIPNSEQRGLFLVKMENFKSGCFPFLTRVVDEIYRYLPRRANNDLDILLKKIKNGERALRAPLKTMEDLVEHLASLTSIVSELPKLEVESQHVAQMFSAAFEYHVPFNAEEKALYQTLKPTFSQYKHIIEACEARKDSNIQKFSKELDTLLLELSSSLQTLASNIHKPSLIDCDSQQSIVYETIEYLKDDLEVLRKRAKTFFSYEECFNSANMRSRFPNAYTISSVAQKERLSIGKIVQDISKLEQDLVLRKLAWKSSDDWSYIYSKWIHTMFIRLDVNAIQKEVSRYIQTVHHLEKGLPSNTLVPSLKEKVMDFKSRLSVVSCLRNPFLKQRHWIEINSFVGNVLFDDNSFSLDDLLQLDIFQYEEQIHELSIQASNEFTLEEMLQKVLEQWKVTDLNLVAHGTRDIAIITKADEILTILDESIVILANIRASRFSSPLLSTVDDFDQKLHLFSLTFKEWVIVQRNWLFLERVFSASDIQRQLPSEAKLFNTVDKSWKDIMRRTVDQPNAMTACTTAGFYENLRSCNNNLEKIHRTLEYYLESKRLLFSRFYFLSSNELLDILANSKHVETVQPYLYKCFANIRSVEFERKEKSSYFISQINSKEGEAFIFPDKLQIRGTVEQWLASFEISLFNAVKLSIKQGLKRFYDTSLIEWLDEQSGEIALVIVQISFCASVEKILLDNNGKNDKERQLKEYCEVLKTNIGTLSDYVTKDLLEFERLKVVALIIILVHARDILSALIRQGFLDVQDFEWTRYLRFYWDEEKNNCMIKQSISSFIYGYEYLGSSSRLVITPLTDRCFLTLTGALHFHLGGSLIGPAGTGKSETVKDLAKALGKHCVVFNCSEGLDIKMVSRLLSGVSQSGSWLCLDEFNRIDTEVLSVVAQRLQTIRSAKLAKAVRFYFELNEIRLNSSSGVFITMNPHYEGRVELPDNLNSLFRPMSVITPDQRQIVEIILFSNGFLSAKELSSKLVNLYELAQKQLSEQNHYDFGLRSIKALLVMAGEINRKSNYDNRRNSVEEKNILLHAIQESNFPRLTIPDRNLFHQITLDIFSEIPSISLEKEFLKKYINAALRELLLQKCPEQLEKVMQFYNTLNVRHGVILIGPSCGGKSTLRKILQKSLVLFENENESEVKDESHGQGEGKSKVMAVDEIIISPKSCSLEELYGYLDPDSAEWNDGLIASSIRNFVQNNTLNFKRNRLKLKDVSESNESFFNGQVNGGPVRSLHQWLVLDGPVDTLWVENLNTLLDESKTLCLANGERIQIMPTMNVIFEVGTLDKASPATISRCGMIFCEPDALRWQYLVKSWLNKLREQKVSENDRNGLWDLFKLTLDPGFEFLEKYKAFYTMNISKLVVLQLLFNLLEPLVKFIYHNDEMGKNNENEDPNDVDESTKDTRTRSSQSSTTTLRPLLIKVYLFSYMWAFGGLFNYVSEESDEMSNDIHLPTFHIEGSIDIRHVFDTFIRELFESKFQIVLPFGSNLLYSYYVNIEKNQFLLWDHFVINATMDMKENHNFFNDKIKITGASLIPTSSAICYSFLIALLSLNNNPVLLMGSRGVGKTALIVDVLRRLQDPSRSMILDSVLKGSVAKNPLEMGGNEVSHVKHQSSLLTSKYNFSAHTSVNEPKNAIQSKLMKQNQILGSRSGEKVIFFFDDLNMPKPDKFGSIAPLEVLREFLTYGGFYIPNSLEWKAIQDINLIASFTLDEGSQQKDLNRVLSKFNTFCFPQPSSRALHHIYVTEFAKFIDWNEFHGEVRDVKSQIISALLGVYYDVSLKLKATPTKSHYLFNLHDIGKVLKGLVQADPEEIKSRENILYLLIHELSRVFLDRLTCDNDILIFYEVLAKQLHEFFKTKYSAQFLKESFIVFGDFFETGLRREERSYKLLSDESKLIHIIEEYHFQGKILDVGIPNEMVFFPQVFRHIASTARILRQPEGHVLLLGVGGTGKKSNARLACFIQQCEFVELSFSRSYSFVDFKEEVKKLLIKAGVKGSPVALYLTDVSNMYDSFLEVICNLITTWNIFLFIDNETKKSIVTELKEEALSNEISNNLEDIFEYFVLKVKQNFHLIYSATPTGTDFADKCSTYPALINNFVIDWYNKWPEKALHIVADKFVVDEDIERSVSKIFVSSYCYIDAMSERYYREMKRYYYVTPKSFLDYLTLFKQIRVKRNSFLTLKKERLSSGLSKLELTNTMVTEMKADLSILEPKLAKKAEETRLLLTEIQKDEEKLKKVRAVVNKEQEVTDSEAKRIAKIAQDAERDLESVLPRLEEATAALDSLNKYDVGEIRSYANPPTMVMTVLSAVCVALNEKPDWSTAKLLLGDPGFLKRLISYDHENMNDRIYTSLKKYCRSSDFNPLAIGKISIACKSMCSWILALVNYVSVNRLVQPKKIKCEEARNALSAAKKNLLIKQGSLRKVENQFRALEQRYKDNVEQLQHLEQSKDLTVKRLKTAALLIDSLSFEEGRWRKTLEELKEKSAYDLSESIIAASACSFLGAFTPDYRACFIQYLISTLISYDMKIIKEFDFVTHLSTSIEVQDWINCGLPADQHSVQNAVFIQESEKWPYLIDPQGQALNWIKKKDKNVKLQIVKEEDPKLITILENAVRFGEVVIVLNPKPSVNSSLNRIILSPKVKRDGQIFMRIDDKEIICNENFKLYLMTESSNPVLLPELCIKVTIINFTVTVSGLTNQLLARIIQIENSELEEKRNNVLQLIVKERMRVTNLENRSLELLYSSTGNILDDEFLINSLDNSRAISENIKQSVSEAEKTEEEINNQREVYRCLAERAAILFFISQDLSTINSVYQFSLSSFFNLFSNCVTYVNSNKANRPLSARTRLGGALLYASSNPVSRRRILLLSKIQGGDINSYIDTMIQIFTETFYRNISYGLFARHQLMFSFYLTTKILLHGGKENINVLSKDEYDIFLGREASIGSTKTRDESQSTSGVNLSASGILITPSQLEECAYLATTLKPFEGILDHMDSHAEWWKTFVLDKNPLELADPVETGGDSIFQFNQLTMFQRLILIRVLRPDKIEEYLPSFITSIFDAEMNLPYGFDIDTIYEECSNKIPIMFILSPGSDPLSSLLSFVKEKRGSVLHLEVISLGRGQSQKTLEKIRNGFTKKGSWVYIQNCHLALSFMSQLDETIREIIDDDTEVNPQFRLFLSTEPNASIPSSIFQSCMKVSVEPPSGVKNNLINSIKPAGGVVSESFFEDTSVINPHWKQLVYSLCLFHAVVQERWKFGSLGWNTPYRFFASDLNTGLMVLQTVIGSCLSVPWKELNILTGEVIYGGRIRNYWDQRCLSTLVKSFYSSDIDKQNFSYLKAVAYKPPMDSSSFFDCLNLIESLPSVDHNNIFGINENILTQSCYADGLSIVDLLDAMELKQMSTNTPSNETDKYIEQRITDLSKSLDLIDELLSDKKKKKKLVSERVTLPKSKQKVQHKDNSSSVSEPNQTGETHCAIKIVFKREVDKFTQLLSVLRNDLTALHMAITGDTVLTSRLKQIYYSIAENKVPRLWLISSRSSCKRLPFWAKYLVKRATYLSFCLKSTQSDESNNFELLSRALCLPSFFYPQGVLTAFLQNYARQNKCSIDSLRFTHHINGSWAGNNVSTVNSFDPFEILNESQNVTEPSNGICVFGLFLDGACWNYEKNVLEELSFGHRLSPLPKIVFLPQPKDDNHRCQDDSLYECPLYQTFNRRDEHFPNYITSIFLPTDTSPEKWILNGVAAVCHTDQ